LITLSEEQVGRLLVGRRVAISVGEPWDFESADGLGALNGKIARVAPGDGDEGRQIIEVEVTPFESREGVTVSRLRARQRYEDETGIVEQVAAGEVAPANLDYSDEVPEEQRKPNSVPKLIGSLRLAE
jgi:hypothetical protein